MGPRRKQVTLWLPFKSELDPIGLDCPEWRLIDHTGEYKPYAAALTAHNGQLELGRSCQSGVFLKGRDRSKKAVLKKEAGLK